MSKKQACFCFCLHAVENSLREGVYCDNYCMCSVSHCVFTKGNCVERSGIELSPHFLWEKFTKSRNQNKSPTLINVSRYREVSCKKMSENFFLKKAFALNSFGFLLYVFLLRRYKCFLGLQRNLVFNLIFSSLQK